MLNQHKVYDAKKWREYFKRLFPLEGKIMKITVDTESAAAELHKILTNAADKLDAPPPFPHLTTLAAGFNSPQARDLRTLASLIVPAGHKEQLSGLNDFAEAVHKNAVEHGWWEEERSAPEILVLCVSELAEAMEEDRAGKPQIYEKVASETTYFTGGAVSEIVKETKPAGLAIELADCIIHILDFCAHEEIDIAEAIRKKHEYNKTRPHRHGGKKY